MRTHTTTLGWAMTLLLGAFLLLGIALIARADYELDSDSMEDGGLSVSGDGFSMEESLEVSDTYEPVESSDSTTDTGDSDDDGGGSGGGSHGGGRRTTEVASSEEEEETESGHAAADAVPPRSRPTRTPAEPVVSTAPTVPAKELPPDIADNIGAPVPDVTIPSVPGATEKFPEEIVRSPVTGARTSPTSTPLQTAAALGSVTLAEAGFLARLAWIARLRSLYGVLPFLS